MAFNRTCFFKSPQSQSTSNLSSGMPISGCGQSCVHRWWNTNSTHTNMNRNSTYRLHFALLLFALVPNVVRSQSVNIKIYVDYVQTLRSRDCDLFALDSDFGFEFAVTHLNNTNNSPTTTLLSNGNYFAYDEDDGPYQIFSPDSRFNPSTALIFDYYYSCFSNLDQITLDWIAYESDDFETPPNNNIEGVVGIVRELVSV